MSRRQLPAPPLILQPLLCRVRQTSEGAARLLQAARFLQQQDLLTDGGRGNLSQGLVGRGEMLSLTTQDVRSGAHALALELLAEADTARWSELAELYSLRYDRGKPRRPNRLQRLYLEWSRDLGLLGMLEACQSHPRLWDAVGEALTYMDPEDEDRTLMDVAVSVRRESDARAWLAAYRAASNGRADRLLEMLPLLPSPPLTERLAWLVGEVESRGGRESHVLAVRRGQPSPPSILPAALRGLTLKLVEEAPGESDPRWLAVQRGYRWPRGELSRLRAGLRPEDPIHRIVYGARPGRPWLDELMDGLGLGED